MLSAMIAEVATCLWLIKKGKLTLFEVPSLSTWTASARLRQLVQAARRLLKAVLRLIFIVGDGVKRFSKSPARR